MVAIDRRKALGGMLAAWAIPAPSWAAAPAVTLPLEQIAPGVLVAHGAHELFNTRNQGFISNSCVIVGRDAAAVIDTSGSLAAGRSLLAAVRAHTDRPVRVVINTHMHPDHVFGNAAFEAPGVEFVGNAKLPRALAARGERYLAANAGDLGADAFEGTRIIAPTLLVETERVIDLGDRKLTLKARRTSHTDNDLSVRDETTGTLILGDLLFSGHIPVVDGSLKGWLALMDELQKEPADRCVPGHGPASMAWPSALDDQRRYLETLARDVRSVIKAGGTLELALKTAGQNERGKWALFDEFHGRNISAAFAELEWE